MANTSFIINNVNKDEKQTNKLVIDVKIHVEKDPLHITMNNKS
jgi:hypothetical protein